VSGRGGFCFVFPSLPFPQFRWKGKGMCFPFFLWWVVVVVVVVFFSPFPFVVGSGL